VPWSVRDAFKVWALGYSFTYLAQDAGATAQFLAPGQPIVGGTFTIIQNSSWQLSRVIPAQDPEHPWLYAESCRPIAYAGTGTSRNVEVLDVTAGSGNGQQWPASRGAGLQPDQSEWPPAVGGAGQGDDGILSYEVIYKPRNYEVRNDTATDALPGGELNRYGHRHKQRALQTIPVQSGTLSFVAGMGVAPDGSPVPTPPDLVGQVIAASGQII
jgi:hypothetical protein